MSKFLDALMGALMMLALMGLVYGALSFSSTVGELKGYIECKAQAA